MTDRTKAVLIDSATRLLEGEPADVDARPGNVPRDRASACEQLVECLAGYVGRAGARALFDRALVLSSREHAWLAQAIGPADESRWARLRSAFDASPAAAGAGAITLVVTLVELFSTFVGESLALQILHQHRPDVFPVAASEEKA